METKPKKIKITLDGQEIFLDEGISILDAARQHQIHIPTLCHHPDLSAWGGCRLCLVEVDGSPKLAASCVTPVRDGMEVVTSNEKIIQSRRTLLEFLFAERNHNCMICPASGDCELQSLAYALQMDHLTVSPSFDTFSMDLTSPYMALDHNRCVLCGRCVRACGEIAGAHVLNFINRGPENRIGFDLNESREGSSCHSCGVCLQVCPTGAISNRYRAHYAVKGHDRFQWHQQDSFCPLCGLLCPTLSTVCDNTLVKVEGFLGNSRPGQGQLCARGRFDLFKTRGERVSHPLVRDKNGNWEPVDWNTALGQVAEKFNQTRDTHGGDAIWGMASSYCANETLILFKKLLNQGWKSGFLDTLDGTHFRTLLKARGRVDGPWQEASWKCIAGSDFILMVGANSCQVQPAVRSLILRQVLEKGTKLAMMGEAEHLSAFTTWHLPVKAGEEPLLIKAMLREALDSVGEPSWARTRILEETKKIHSSEILQKLGLDPGAIQRFHEMVAAFATAQNPLILAGEGLTGLKDVSGLQDTLNLALLKGFLPENVLRLMILKPQGNSAGAWQMEVCSPQEPGGSNEWKAGLLLLSGEEKITEGFADQMGRMGFLGVITPYFPETLAQRAHIILPIPLWMEEDGTYTSLDGRETIFKKGILAPLEGVGTCQSLLSTLAQKAGILRVKEGKKAKT